MKVETYEYVTVCCTFLFLNGALHVAEVKLTIELEITSLAIWGSLIEDRQWRKGWAAIDRSNLEVNNDGSPFRLATHRPLLYQKSSILKLPNSSSHGRRCGVSTWRTKSICGRCLYLRQIILVKCREEWNKLIVRLHYAPKCLCHWGNSAIWSLSFPIEFCPFPNGYCSHFSCFFYISFQSLLPIRNAAVIRLTNQQDRTTFQSSDIHIFCDS